MQTIQDFVHRLMAHPDWGWTRKWFNDGGVIVSTPARNWHEYRPGSVALPTDLVSLGSTGRANGRLCWVGWDLDVGHGTTSYPSTETALVDADRLRHVLDGQAEIRLSRSGWGVHVRSMVPPNGRALPSRYGPAISRILAGALGLRADPTSLGRQAHWLWVSDPAPGAFALVHPHAPLRDGPPPIVAEICRLLTEAVQCIASRRASENQPQPARGAETRHRGCHPPSGDGNLFERACRYVAVVPAALQGERNSELNRLAFNLLRRFHLTLGQLMTVCMGFADDCCPPLDEREALRTIESAWNGYWQSDGGQVGQKGGRGA